MRDDISTHSSLASARLRVKKFTPLEFRSKNNSLSAWPENPYEPRVQNITDPTCFITVARNYGAPVEGFAAPKPDPTNNPPPHPIDPYGSRMLWPYQATGDNSPTLVLEPMGLGNRTE